MRLSVEIKTLRFFATRIAGKVTMHHFVKAVLFLAVLSGLATINNTAAAQSGFVPVYGGGICVADGAGSCVGGDIRAESGLGSQVGYMKTTADAGTVAVYQSTCYSDGGTCTAWGLSLDVNGTPVGYLSTTAPDAQSANAPLVQSNGLLLQNLGGTPSAFLWTIIPPSIANLSSTFGPVGTPVTITGANFGSTQGTSSVTFNGIAATPSSWSATSITAPPPATATTGPVVVTVGGVASNSVSFPVTTKLTITSVNGGSNPVAGSPFSVVVQSQDASGAPASPHYRPGGLSYGRGFD